MSLLGKFLALPARRRRVLVEAVLGLALARLALLLLPFRRIAPYLERQRVSASDLVDRPPGHDDVAWGVAAASRHLPWKCRCLAQALTGQIMLRRRGIASSLHLGLAREGEAGWRAHAWLEGGDGTPPGGRERSGFTVIARFGATDRHPPAAAGVLVKRRQTGA